MLDRSLPTSQVGRREPELELLPPGVFSSIAQADAAEVCAGFLSSADDHIEGEFDLQELPIKNPPATFLVRVAGENMKDAQIYPGDLLVVDRSKEARDGSIIVACLDGKFTVKRLRKKGKRVWLQPENGELHKHNSATSQSSTSTKRRDDLP